MMRRGLERMGDVLTGWRRAGPSATPADRGGGWLATGSLLGALLASACCVGPLVLLTLGVSGAWIGNLTVLEPYKGWFAAAALAFVALGFRRIYFRGAAECTESAACARPGAARLTRAALWLATVLVALALTIEWWAPLLY